MFAASQVSMIGYIFKSTCNFMFAGSQVFMIGHILNPIQNKIKRNARKKFKYFQIEL